MLGDRPTTHRTFEFVGDLCRCLFAALAIFSAYAKPASADDLDRYRYVLEKSTNDRVCDHIKSVFNVHFRYPWRTPLLGVEPEDSSYGPSGRYAFPLLPGVTHNDRMR